MKIISGKYKGKTGRVHQFENDWMTVDLDGVRPGQVVKPTVVQLTEPDEFERFRTENPTRRFFREWRLNDDGTFSALRAGSARLTSGETP